MRYAILCAVSTKDQATLDKISLPHQEKTCRQTGAARGWDETAGPYKIEGQSRTKWDDLHEALERLPELRRMMNEAEQGLFDVLIIYDYNRLRDLLNQVAKMLIGFNVQIFSVNQPIEPIPPQEFHPYASDAEPMVRGMSQIISQWTISDLRRKYKVGMPARIDRGLNPLKPPFGYRWVSKKEPPAQEAAKCALILEMKDLLFAGQGIYEIGRYADASGIEPPMLTRRSKPDRKWDPKAIKYILSNPFYAGMVALHKSITVRDVHRKNKQRPVFQPRSKWKMGKGLHKPLWDEATYHAILREFERRYESTHNYAARYPYSGLLFCGECGSKLHRHNWGGPGVTIVDGKKQYGRQRVLACTNAGKAHVVIGYDEGVKIVSDELKRRLSEMQTAPAQPVTDTAPEEDPTVKLVADLKRKRKQIQEDREAGIYEQAEAVERITAIQDQIARLEQKTEAVKETTRRRDEFKALIGNKLEYFTEWVMEDDPQIVHRWLHALCKKILVHPDHRIEFEWQTGL